jgi:hypothetical protein
MPGSRPPSSPQSDDGPALEAVLAAARKALSRGDGWTIEQNHYDRLRADCEAIGIEGDVAITIALRHASREITVANMRRRDDQSYGGLHCGQVLYDCRWESERHGCRMYLKFALGEGGELELFTFHRDTGEEQR